MTSKYNKTIVLVGLFVIVLAVGIIIKTDTGRSYLSWLKATASSMFGTNVEAPSDKGLADNIDLSNIDIAKTDDKTVKTPEIKTETQAQVSYTPKKPVTQAEIESVVQDVSAQIAKIEMEIKQMAINSEIQKQIDQIAIQVDKVGQEVNILRTNTQITEIQQKISVLSQQIGLIFQQIGASA